MINQHKEVIYQHKENIDQHKEVMCQYKEVMRRYKKVYDQLNIMVDHFNSAAINCEKYFKNTLKPLQRASIKAEVAQKTEIVLAYSEVFEQLPTQSQAVCRGFTLLQKHIARIEMLKALIKQIGRETEIELRLMKNDGVKFSLEHLPI